MTVAPLATIHPGQPDELSCPGIVRFRRERPPGALAPGEAWTVVSDRGEPEATFGVLPGGGIEAIRWQTHLALTIAERCAMLLEVLNAPNVQLTSRELHGKRARQAERAGHPLPRIIKVHRPVPAEEHRGAETPGGGATRISSPFVGTSPTTDAGRSTIRTRPSGFRSPSSAEMPCPCGTRHRFADPKMRPTCLACDCSRIARAIDRPGRIEAGGPSSSGRTADRLLAASLTRRLPRGCAC